MRSLLKLCVFYIARTNISVNSKHDHPPGDSQVLTARGVECSPNFLCPGGRGFEFEKFPTVLKENAGISRFVSKKLEAA